MIWPRTYGIIWRVPNRSRNEDRQIRQAAALLNESSTTSPAAYPGKDPAAVELGRRGGLKGGRARADKLTAKQRSDIARRAAQARWRGRG